MTEEKKQEIEKAKEEVKKEPKEISKLCPFISGFVMELSKISLKENGLIKTTNVAPCIQHRCMFFNDTEMYCKISKGLDDLHNSFEYDEIEEEQEEQGEGTDNE